MGKKIDITNQTFFWLTAIRGEWDKRKKKSMWECLCICGNSTKVSLWDLKNGTTKSCGCYNSIYHTKHGYRKGGAQPTEYKIWANMKDRCNNPNCGSYVDYGGRGIKVCQRWDDSFENFLADVGFRPSKNHSLDRYPDNNGDYEPGNVRWATVPQQQRNRRNNAIITYNGKSLCVKEWSEITGITVDTINYRREMNWEIDKMLTTPMRNFKNRPNIKSII